MNEIIGLLHESLDLLDEVLFEMEMDDRTGSDEYEARCDLLNRIVDAIEKHQKGAA